MSRVRPIFAATIAALLAACGAGAEPIVFHETLFELLREPERLEVEAAVASDRAMDAGRSRGT